MTSSEEEERRQKSRGLAAFAGYYEDAGDRGRRRRQQQQQQQQQLVDATEEEAAAPSPAASARRRGSGSGKPQAGSGRPSAATPEKPAPSAAERRSPRGADFRRYSVPEDSFNKSMDLDSESSESEEDGEDIDVEKFARMKLAEFCDTKQFENLPVSSEVKELFHNVIRYTPQKIDLQYKLIPFIPDYIPAVGDIDAFLKVPRPDGATDRSGLLVLDEPATEQSEPAVLHLQLRSKIRSAAGSSKDSVMKRLANASKHGRHIDKWIEDMSQLHRSKHPPAVQLSHKFPSTEALLQPWPADVEEKLHLDPPASLLKVDCSLLQLIDLICALLDIPVYENARIESLHTLFALYTEVHNVDIQRIHNS